MNRRTFIAGLGGAAAWPVVARAQQQAMPVIGYLGTGSAELSRDFLPPFQRGLAETGYIEGRNVTIEYRWAEDRPERLPSLAADLVRRQVAVIATPGTAASALAAKAATQSIPIVFLTGADPVEIGLIASLNQPGANLTGVAIQSAELTAKRLEMLHELIPAATSVAFLVNPSNATFTSGETTAARAAARVLALNLLILNASTPGEMEVAFESLINQQAGALLISGDRFLAVTQRDRIVAFAARHRIPAVYDRRENATAGGLASYGVDVMHAIRQVGVYTGRVLKGERPADLPVQQLVKIELVINMKTAKALGLTIPETLLATADEVIQ
jgi:putative tryptophan/tyrosine transport system substrate-binding protein